MEALWATILFSGFALEVIIRQRFQRKARKLPLATSSLIFVFCVI
jgi:hypothetical protein